MTNLDSGILRWGGEKGMTNLDGGISRGERGG